LKKSIIALIVLVLILSAWLVSRIWFVQPDDGNVTPPVQSPLPGNEPDPDEDDRTQQDLLDAQKKEEEERLKAEQEAAQREAELAERRHTVLEESRLLFRGYFYDEALVLLNADEDIINHETQALEDEILAEVDSLTLYQGDIKHIFFHSLILYPEFLFPNISIPQNGYNERFIYKSEFIRLLPQLLERNYVLYDINDVFSKDENGIMRQNDIYLPPGKIPLILSLDDVSYHYGHGWSGGGPNGTGFFNRTRRFTPGWAKKIIFDDYGELASLVVPPLEGETMHNFKRNAEGADPIITYDGDVFLVLEDFVKEHPEFSIRGHKGIIDATGYMGIFGYDLAEEGEEDTREVVSAIGKRVKESG